MSHTTVFVIMDSGRADYVGPSTMPFLSGLAQTALTGSLESPPGYAQRTVAFSGRYPDTSGNFSAYVFDPESSPFRWVRALGPLRSLVRPYRPLYPARVGLRQVTRWATGAHHADPAWIPPRYLPFFRPTEDMRPVYEPDALGAPSIFDLCRDHGKSFRYLAHPIDGDDTDVHATLVRDLRAGAKRDLYVAQLSDPDRQGHAHGPNSPEMLGYLRELDDRLAHIHAALTSGHESWDLFLCGDHGMAPVRDQVDILRAVETTDARPGKDYVVFVHSTLAVFWYLTDRGRREIEGLLPTIHGARLLGTTERARLRIPLDRGWGDRMLAARPGTVFWPDYFHVRSAPPRGMHGYLDKSEETHGTMLLASNRSLGTGSVGVRPLADVFPTLCDLLDVPVPATNEGRTLLPRARPTFGSAPLVATIPAG